MELSLDGDRFSQTNVHRLGKGLLVGDVLHHMSLPVNLLCLPMYTNL
jgi:hypothetical protein